MSDALALTVGAVSPRRTTVSPPDAPALYACATTCNWTVPKFWLRPRPSHGAYADADGWRRRPRSCITPVGGRPPGGLPSGRIWCHLAAGPFIRQTDTL